MKHIRFMRYFISLALPVILQQLLAHLLAMSDTIMLGAFSEQAISAVSVANKYFFIYNLVCLFHNIMELYRKKMRIVPCVLDYGFVYILHVALCLFF